MKKILYLSAFKDEYNEKVFIQRRKKYVLQNFDSFDCSIHFVHNEPGKFPLNLTNSESFYHELMFCNVTNKFKQKIHNILFKYTSSYAYWSIRKILAILPIKINNYDLIIAESWETAYAVLPFVKNKKIVTRIYGTSDLTERIEKNLFWRINPFLRKIYSIVNSNKVKNIVFNSTGSRSRDLFKYLSKGNENKEKPLYLEMPNILFEGPRSKKRMQNGKICILHVGTMNRNRGFDLTIKIVEILRTNCNLHVKALMAGDGPIRNELHELASRLSLLDYVEFTGKLDLVQLRDCYIRSDVLINYYGFNPVIEALNYHTFAITREFGEMEKILGRHYNKNAFHVCLKDQPFIEINKRYQDRYVSEVVSAIEWYSKNYMNLTKNDFKPIKPVTIGNFAEQVFSCYKHAIFEK